MQHNDILSGFLPVLDLNKQGHKMDQISRVSIFLWCTISVKDQILCALGHCWFGLDKILHSRTLTTYCQYSLYVWLLETVPSARLVFGALGPRRVKARRLAASSSTGGSGARIASPDSKLNFPSCWRHLAAWAVLAAPYIAPRKMLLSVPPRTGINPYNGYNSRNGKKVNPFLFFVRSRSTSGTTRPCQWRQKSV